MWSHKNRIIKFHDAENTHTFVTKMAFESGEFKEGELYMLLNFEVSSSNVFKGIVFTILSI